MVATLSMPGDATTLPLRENLAGRARARRRGRQGPRAGALAGAQLRVRAAALSLGLIVLLCALIVVLAADRPSLLSATSHVGFFPRWMAGPLGGLWPGAPRGANTLKYIFSGAVVLMYGGYLLIVANARALPLRWVVAAIAAVHVIFLLSPPLALTDIFNYINYGRMEIVHHLNPYTTIPILEPHNDPAYLLSNWHQLLSPYGPVFTLLTFAVVPLGVAASFWVLKLVLGLTSLATIYLVWRCARLLGRDQATAVALVGLNPIVLVWGLGGDHNDFLIMFCIVLGFYLLLRAQARGAATGVALAGEPKAQAQVAAAPAPAAAPARPRGRAWLLPLSATEMGAGAAFVMATGLKASGGVLIPVVLAGLLRAPRALLQVALGMLVAVAVVGGASLMAFGLHIPDLGTQSRVVTNESVPNLIGLVLGEGGQSESLHKVMSVVLALAIGACCVQAWRRRDALTACGWASMALLVTLGWVLPWYVLWALPFAALSSSRRLRVAVLVFGVYMILAWSPASGLLWSAIGFHPEKTPLGRLHQRYVKELLN